MEAIRLVDKEKVIKLVNSKTDYFLTVYPDDEFLVRGIIGSLSAFLTMLTPDYVAFDDGTPLKVKRLGGKE